MRNFKYDFALLKKAREDKGISKLEMAHQLCLSVNQINSIEEDNFRYFPDECIKLYAIKKYALALNIDISKVVTVIEDEKSLFNSSQDLPAVISATRYSNKTNYLRQVWKDLLARLLKK
jgi:cytoskeletal protein RodZ